MLKQAEDEQEIDEERKGHEKTVYAFSFMIMGGTVVPKLPCLTNLLAL